MVPKKFFQMIFFSTDATLAVGLDTPSVPTEMTGYIIDLSSYTQFILIAMEFI